jgi:hypothetical protein
MIYHPNPNPFHTRVREHPFTCTEACNKTSLHVYTFSFVGCMPHQMILGHLITYAHLHRGVLDQTVTTETPGVEYKYDSSACGTTRGHRLSFDEPCH